MMSHRQYFLKLRIVQITAFWFSEFKMVVNMRGNYGTLHDCKLFDKAVFHLIFTACS